MRSARCSRGVTLAELVVALLAAALVATGAYQVLLSAQRFLRAQSALLEVQQSLRVTTQILSAELRELDPSGGDIVAMGPDSISIRAMRSLAITCAPAGEAGGIVLRNDLSFGYRALDPERDRALVFTDSRGGTGEAGWLDFRVTGATPGARCVDGREGTRLALAGGAPAESIAAGSPVRTYERVVYRLYQDEGGVWWLGMRGFTGGAWSALSPVAGPLLRSTGLAFSYLDSAGAVTPDTAQVASVALTVRAVSSSVLERWGSPPARHADSLAVVVALRNRRRVAAP